MLFRSRIISQTANPTDKYGYIQVERLEDGNARLRCVWQNERYVGFDSRNVGSYIYADKTSPGEFILEDLDEDATQIDIPLATPASEEYIYNLGGQRISTPTKGVYIKNGRKIIQR